MKIFISLLFLLFATFDITGQTEKNAFDEIYNLLEKDNFFEARKLYKIDKENLSKPYQQLTEAFLNNAFNNLRQSQNNIDGLLSAKKLIPDSLALKLYGLKVDNAIKMYKYKEAEEALNTLLNNYQDNLTEKEREDLENDHTYGKL